MVLSSLAVVLGLVLLLWGADRFVEGAASTAAHFSVPPLLIGMVIIGFGTSLPELLVSGLASAQGSPEIAIGNAYGSNIANIALILGLTALIHPIAVQSKVLKVELPILAIISTLAAWQLSDGQLQKTDAAILLLVFAVTMAGTCFNAIRRPDDVLGEQVQSELKDRRMSFRVSVLWLVLGLVLLIGSSRLLVWGATEIATQLGVSDLVIGLTIVAVGTSLPELAASVIATRRGEHDLALGNVLGSNLFNTLAVVGLAGIIQPMDVGNDVIYRDMPVMLGLTFTLFLVGFGFRGPGRINRWEGLGLITLYVGYVTVLIIKASEATG